MRLDAHTDLARSDEADSLVIEGQAPFAAAEVRPAKPQRPAGTVRESRSGGPETRMGQKGSDHALNDFADSLRHLAHLLPDGRLPGPRLLGQQLVVVPLRPRVLRSGIRAP